MKVVLIDDEARALALLKSIIEKVDNVSVLGTFTDPLAGLDFVKNHKVDAVFCDIEMPEMNGIDLAKELNESKSDAQIVFVTGYQEYALEAWSIQASGYILKPYSKEQIINKLQQLNKSSGEKRIKINCFPILSVHYNSETVALKSKKEVELLAYLVHNRGAWVNKEQVLATLFEDNAEQSRSYYNSLIMRLRDTLKKYGIDDLIQTESGKCRVNTEIFDCDYYEYLKGENDLFHGEYLINYDWAEPANAKMLFEKPKKY